MNPLVNVSADCVAATLDAIAVQGRQGLEGSAFWLGSVETLEVEGLVLPTGERVSHGPRGIEIAAEWMILLADHCEAHAQVVLAGLHSHPYAAYHSEVDEVGLLHAPDFVSIVLPNYGFTSLAEAPFTWAVYVGVEGGAWRPTSWTSAVRLDGALKFQTHLLGLED